MKFRDAADMLWTCLDRGERVIVGYVAAALLAFWLDGRSRRRREERELLQSLLKGAPR